MNPFSLHKLIFWNNIDIKYITSFKTKLTEHLNRSILFFIIRGVGGRDGTVVRGFASYHCGPGSIQGPGVKCVLCFLLVLIVAPWVFLLFLCFSSIHKNQHSKFQFDLETVDKKSHLIECTLLNPISFLFYEIYFKTNMFKHT